MRRLAPLILAGCATLADGAPGLDNPPSARAGPFRLLGVGELGQERVPPNAVDDQTFALRSPSILDVDGDPATLAIEGYFAASEDDAGPIAPSTRIVRLTAADGRSFARDATVVLTADPALGWQGGTVGAPSVVLGEDGDKRLYFDSAGGIGLAIDTGDGFEALPEPVLTPAHAPWATGPLSSPGVVLVPGLGYRLYFESEVDGVSVIGVASSVDGVAFEQATVAITPGGAEDIDGAYVGSPSAAVGESAEGREIVYVYYTARSRADKQSISMAAWFVDEPLDLDKSGAAMYGPSGGVLVREPSVVRFDTFTLLFSSQKKARDNEELVVTVGVSPGNIELPPAE